MAFSVIKYKSPQALQDAIGGTVTVANSEEALGEVINAATSLFLVVDSGNFYTAIDSPTIVNVSLRIVGAGAMYTVILETA
jgi:hypothetical protein